MQLGKHVKVLSCAHHSVAPGSSLPIAERRTPMRLNGGKRVPTFGDFAFFARLAHVGSCE